MIQNDTEKVLYQVGNIKMSKMTQNVSKRTQNDTEKVLYPVGIKMTRS